MINTVIRDNNEQTINHAIKCIEIQSTRTLVRNPKAMLLSAIKEQWHPDKYTDLLSIRLTCFAT
jgi:hypothetical protein